MLAGRLLAVDVGVHCGLALFERDGRLCQSWSRNFGNRSRLKTAVHAFLGEIPDLAYLVLEGRGDLAVLWQREGKRRGLRVLTISAETWRARLLLPRHRRSGRQAKRHAGPLARQALVDAGLSPPASLTIDRAEAILVGLWAVEELDPQP